MDIFSAIFDAENCFNTQNLQDLFKIAIVRSFSNIELNGAVRVNLQRVIRRLPPLSNVMGLSH